MVNNLLNGQRVLVVGGGSRMGLAVAKRSAEAGAVVTISGRSLERLQEAASTMPGVSVQAADFGDASQAQQLMQRLAPLDHLIVTASSPAPAGGIPDTEPAIAQDAFSRFWISYHALHFTPGVISPSGSVVLLSGSSGRRPIAGYGVWGSLHGSLEALARSAALELAPIRVNVVSPGGIGITPDRQLAHHAGQPEDVAAMVVALLSNPAVTNAVVDVDGGERLGTWP